MPTEVKAPNFAGDVVTALLGYFARSIVGLMLVVLCFSVIKVHLQYWQHIGAKLPEVTVKLTWFSMYMLRDGWWQLPPLVATFDLIVTLLLVFRFRHHRWLSTAYAQVLLLGMIAFLFWAYACVTIPLTGLLPDSN